MSDDEIFQNIGEKVDILKWFVNQQVKDLNNIGRLVGIYYSTPDFMMDAVKRNDKLENVLKSWSE